MEDLLSRVEPGSEHDRAGSTADEDRVRMQSRRSVETYLGRSASAQMMTGALPPSSTPDHQMNHLEGMKAGETDQERQA